MLLLLCSYKDSPRKRGDNRTRETTRKGPLPHCAGSKCDAKNRDVTCLRLFGIGYLRGWMVYDLLLEAGWDEWVEGKPKAGDAPPSPERFRGKGKEITRFASNHAINGLPLRAVMQGQNRLQRIIASQKNTIRSSWRNGQRDEMTPLWMKASPGCCSVSRHDGL